ncbi:MAG: hypothetical protein IJX24_06635 [Oscillospiraceae bacterium]|nr:hypothetical protein [Oscillospiraceae bacterium]
MRFSDLLFSRYSQPFLLLNNFIHKGRLCEFIDDFFKLINEAQMWEFWLNKETGRSWSDFKLTCIPQEADYQKLENAASDIEQSFMKGVIEGGFI